jgi:predicted N-acetyltransferase YhbS
VDEGLKGRGIGTRLMEAYCMNLDDSHLAAYLETETARNVRFYERFGFETVDRAEVLGTRTGSCGGTHADVGSKVSPPSSALLSSTQA